MEDNEKQEVLDTQEESNEELEETEESNEVEETTDEPESNDDSSGPTLEDYERLKKEAETLKAQKEHWRKKAEKSVDNKPNNTEFSDEEKLVRLAQLGKDLDSEDLDVLKGLNGKSIEEKVNHPLFKAYKAEKERKKRSNEASLKPSTPGRTFTKGDPNEPGLSQEERDARIKKSMGLA